MPHGSTAMSTKLNNERRKYERIWRKTGSSHDLIQYKKQCKETNTLILTTKHELYSTKIQDNSRDAKAHFNITKTWLGKAEKTQLPDHDSSIELAQRFNNIFINKVRNIRENITPSTLDGDVDANHTPSGTHNIHNLLHT